MSICWKSYVLHNTSGFAQIAQKKLRKTLFVSCAKIREKIFPVLRKNSLRFMRKNCAKVRKKKICAKIAQILRKKYSHFVETLQFHTGNNIKNIFFTYIYRRFTTFYFKFYFFHAFKQRKHLNISTNGSSQLTASLCLILNSYFENAY